jgi:serine/threonine protein phosphatase 1
VIERLQFDQPVAVIGDIHGCAELLDKLLAKLEALPVLVMGDLVDRGPDSKGVLDRLVARGAKGVHGNHEEWFLSWADQQGFDPYALQPIMGGRMTLRSYGITSVLPREIEAEASRVPREHVEFVRSLPVVLDLEVQGTPYYLVHAGLPALPVLAEVPPEARVPLLAERRPDLLLWRKTDPDQMPAAGRTIVMGHLPLSAPVDTGSVLAIDTGAGTFGPRGALTAVILPERRFVTVRR